MRNLYKVPNEKEWKHRLQVNLGQMRLGKLLLKRFADAIFFSPLAIVFFFLCFFVTFYNTFDQEITKSKNWKITFWYYWKR